MKKITVMISLILLIFVAGCGAANESSTSSGSSGHQNVSVSEAKQLIDNGKVKIIDVRTAEEFKEGHIPGAQLLPLQELEGRLKELDKNHPYLLVCRSGNRSEQAQKILRTNDFSTTYNMVGGMSKWTYDVEK